MSILAASAYPAVLVTGAIHLAMGGAAVLSALAALAVVHVGWSVGFWMALLGGAPPPR